MASIDTKALKINRDMMHSIINRIEQANKISINLVDNNIALRAKSLGYTTYNLGCGIIVVETPQETIVSSTSDIKLEEDMQMFFQYCWKLRTLEIKNLDTAHVKNMHAMFEYCGNLEYLNINNLDTRQVKDMGYMFSGCYNLKEIGLHDLDTGQVENMSGMFHGCSSLEKIDISNFKTEQVKHMRSMFNGCSSLEEIDISNFVMHKNVKLDFMFDECKKLKKVYVNNSIKSIILNQLKQSEYKDCSGTRFLLFHVYKVKDIGGNKAVIELKFLGRGAKIMERYSIK